MKRAGADAEVMHESDIREKKLRAEIAAGVPPQPNKYSEDITARTQSNVDFIQSLKFSVPLPKLRANTQRAACPKCGKRKQYYCYNCLAVTSPETHPPPLKMPVDIHVILHPQEHRSKSTTLPSATVSPDNIHIHVYPTDIPGELDPNTTLLLYPIEGAVGLNEIDNLQSYKNLIVIDSTWQQSYSISHDTRYHTKFKFVKLQDRETLFWRFQNKSTSHLATVEAMYYFMKEYIQQCAPDKQYRGEVDDMLYYYVNQFITIQASYKPGSINRDTGDLRVFNTRHFSDYILPGVDWEKVARGEAVTVAAPAAAPATDAKE